MKVIPRHALEPAKGITYSEAHLRRLEIAGKSPLGFLGTCCWSWRLIGSTIALLVWFEYLPEGMGGLHRVKREANFETKASGVRNTLVGGGRLVIVAGERRTRGNRGTSSGYTDAKHRSESRHHSR